MEEKESGKYPDCPTNSAIDSTHRTRTHGPRTTPGKYWAAADAGERANGRLYREVEFALPRELNAAERVELATRFAEHLTGEERLPYTLAIHRGGQDGGNPHAHLMFSERANNDGIERSAAQWFKRYNAKEPEKRGSAEKHGHQAPRLARADPRGLGGSGKRGAGSGGPAGAD